MKKSHLSILVVAGLTIASFLYFGKGHVSDRLPTAEHTDSSVPSAEQDNMMADGERSTERTASEGDSSEPELSSSTAEVLTPKKHVETLELGAMAENFDFHFQNLLDRGQTRSAAQLLLHKSRLNDWHGDKVREFLEEHLAAHPDLLQDPELATTYVIHYGMGIDKDKYNAHLALLEQYHPSLVEGLEPCYEVYRDLTWDGTPVPLVEKKMVSCLTSVEPLASPPEVVSGVIDSYFRSYLIKAYGLDAAIEKARAMRQDFPTLIAEESELFIGYINREVNK